VITTVSIHSLVLTF